MSVLELFCAVDDFILNFEPHWKASQVQAGKQRYRRGQLCASEIMTILIHFHQSHYRTFKAYYREHVQKHLSSEFPHLVSYHRFVALIPEMLVPMLAYLQSRYGACSGISFIWRPRLTSAIPNGSADIGFLPSMPGAAKPVQAGSTGSSCTWQSMIGASYWLVASHQAMWMIALRFPLWSNSCVANCSEIVVTSPLP